MTRTRQTSQDRPRPRGHSTDRAHAPDRSGTPPGARAAVRSAAPTLVRGAPLWVALGLVAITVAAYAGVLHNGFLSWDDAGYVTTNPHVAHGFSLDNVRWAFASGRQSNWHPLTWLSHMMDVQLFGLNAGAHHAVNLLLHVLNSILLFALLLKMTRATWRSAFVAALFALHPMHVESVAWIAERKDVLSTTLLWLTLWAYAGWVERPRLGRYAAMCGLFALGLLAKPMLVTLPFLMLLLDVWPLRRLRLDARWASELAPLMREKLPLFLLAAASAVVTFLVQRHGGAVAGVEKLAVSFRIGNALLSWVGYVLRMVWPWKLSAYYAYASNMSIIKVAACAVALVAVTWLVVRPVRSKPYLAVGWLWFAGMLVPVIGLVQVGSQAMADRYTYVPYVGLFVIVAWGVDDLSARWSGRGMALAVAAAIAIASLAIVTAKQVATWRDDETLWAHALRVAGPSMVTLDNLGATLLDQRRYAEASGIYRQALRLKPNDSKARFGLGLALNGVGQRAQAVEELERVARVRPNDASAHVSLGAALAGSRRLREAIDEYAIALRLDPKLAEAHNNLGAALADSGLVPEAVAEYRTALNLKPGYAQAHKNLGSAFRRLGQPDSAMAQFAEAIAIDPDYALAHTQLAVGYEQMGRWDDAIRHYAEVVRIRPDDADAHNRLGVTLANRGRLDEAVPQFVQALRLDPNNEEARNNLEYAQELARDKHGARP